MSTDLSTYGPWAVIAGASEGVGAAFARRLAAAGIGVVLVARREGPLEALEAELIADHGVPVRTASIDLSRPDAATALFGVTEGLDVGLLVYNAGADPHMELFLDLPVDVWTDMTHRNCVVPLQACHHYAPAMVARGHGGIVLVSSGGAWAGAARIATYGATKAFDLILGEALWAELGPQGVDVLSLVLGTTDTPALRKIVAEKGATLPDMVDPDDVVAQAFEHLGTGPTHVVGLGDVNPMGGLSRLQAVTAATNGAARIAGLA